MAGQRGTAPSTWVVDRAALSADLAAAPDPHVAADVVVDTLLRAGMALPSVYLERAGRLRCMAERGYWQVQDGIPPGAGVIGTTFVEQEAAIVRASESSAYVEAAPEVEWEICVPVVCDGTTVGVVNVEWDASEPADGDYEAIVTAAACLGERLTTLGPLPESSAERLTRHVIALAQLTEPADVAQHALAAARDVSGMPSAALVRFETRGPKLVSASGPLRGFLDSLTVQDWSSVAQWVETGSSCYTMAQSDGVGFVGHDVFRGAGARTIVVIPLTARQQPIGLLILAETEPVLPATEQIERLEILATQVATCLLTASTMTELRDQAARDPLTGLGHQASFHLGLAKALDAEVRDRRAAVLLVDIDHFKRVNDTHGHLAGDRALVEVATSLAGATREDDELFRIGGDEFAAVVQVHDEAEALAIARRLWAAARSLRDVTVSVGVAVAMAGEAETSLLARADDALYAVKAAGRDGFRLASSPPFTSVQPPPLPGHLLQD